MTKKTNTRKFRKLFLLFVVIFITSVVLVVETYAWFVGITTVNVSSFDVTVTSAQGLELSLNGKYWASGDTTITLNSANILSTNPTTASHGYNGSGNTWPTNGLKPLSSSGRLNTSTGRLQLFEKTSLSATVGGYRLVAKQVDNSVTEQDGYIAFDLFIRNGKEDYYSPDNYSVTGGENIYLTKNSSSTYNGTTNHGVANSVRVGFFALAGTKTTTATDNTTVSALQGLSCSTTTSGNDKRICPSNFDSKGLSWHIWEPNHNVHTTASRTYFNNICKQRDEETGEYLSSTCTGFTSNTSEFNTYTILNEVSASQDVDIFDGRNGYSYNIGSTWNNSDALFPTPIYTIPSTYTSNNQLIKLAGNSITKIRVYIWLEGQDVDNYDVIAGDTVKINFGFTKDRFEIANT